MTEAEKAALAKLRKDLGLDELTKSNGKTDELVNILLKKDQDEKDAAAKAEHLKAADARMQEFVDKATGEHKEQLSVALEAIKVVTGRIEKADQTNIVLSDAIKGQKETLEEYKLQVEQILKSRDAPANRMAGIVGEVLGGTRESFEKEIDTLGLLAKITKKGIFETDRGAKHFTDITTKVNQSSNIEVSSDAYESIFSQRLLRDIQLQLVVGNMFTELPMVSANLTMMIDPNPTPATWVAASTYGTPATTGNEIDVVLGQESFITHKLASKAYITDETEEDSIVALLPILRRHLIESHVIGVEGAFMDGNGTNMPPRLTTCCCSRWY